MGAWFQGATAPTAWIKKLDLSFDLDARAEILRRRVAYLNRRSCHKAALARAVW